MTILADIFSRNRTVSCKRSTQSSIFETIYAKPSSNNSLMEEKGIRNMFSLRGDAHKLYLQLKQASNKDQSFHSINAIKKVEEIQNFYTSIDSDTLKNIYYCMIKEKNGSGMIPILISSAPWLLLIFSKQLQEFLFTNGSFLWAIFVFAYLTILTVSVILHFYEKAWASVHIEMIQEILHDRK